MNETKPVENDPVNHPSHYTSHPSGVECIQVTEHMSFNVGNAIKYLWRAGQKGAQLQDLEKARWYVDREIKRLQVEKLPLRVDIGTQPEPPFSLSIGKQYAEQACSQPIGLKKVCTVCERVHTATAFPVRCPCGADL